MKHLRAITKQIKAAMPGVEIKVIRSRVHVVYELRYQSRARHMAVAVSPKNIDHCVTNAVREAQRLLDESER